MKNRMVNILLTVQAYNMCSSCSCCRENW